MKIRYVDEYGVDVYETESLFIASVGDTVVFDDEDYRVKSRILDPREGVVVIELTQNQVRAKASDDNGDRLAEMQRAIIQVNKRQDTQERKAGHLKEQLVSVRSYLRTQKEKK